MKDLSFLLLKNILGAKMKKKGLSNFCNGDGSTSTLNQKPSTALPSLDATTSFFDDTSLSGKTPTLEEMIMQLELEEAETRKKKKKLEDNTDLRRRMSCVNNSDVLKSARNALNQYPRFSLDGRDAMYRSSFRNSTAMAGVYEGRRKSVCSGSGLRGRLSRNGFDKDFERNLSLLPPTVSGDSVVWCKPGVVAKLMGLESMPVPISRRHSSSKGRLSCKTRKQNLRRVERAETEKKRLGMGVNGCRGIEKDNGSSSPTNGYLVMNPISSERCDHEGKSWLMDRMRYARGPNI